VSGAEFVVCPLAGNATQQADEAAKIVNKKGDKRILLLVFDTSTHIENKDKSKKANLFLLFTGYLFENSF
jgi:hypothetical protein